MPMHNTATAYRPMRREVTAGERTSHLTAANCAAYTATAIAAAVLHVCDENDNVSIAAPCVIRYHPIVFRWNLYSAYTIALTMTTTSSVPKITTAAATEMPWRMPKRVISHGRTARIAAIAVKWASIAASWNRPTGVNCHRCASNRWAAVADRPLHAASAHGHAAPRSSRIIRKEAAQEGAAEASRQGERYRALRAHRRS